MYYSLMQASQDGKAWSTLRIHRKDQTLKMAGQYASWPVTGYAACISFRYYRLFQGSSPASSAGQSRRQLSLAYLELYGHFSITNGDSKACAEPL